jgi:chromosome segregation ATPase
MRWPFVLRSRHDDQVAALNADRDRLRRRAETAEQTAATAEYNRGQLLRQLADADATNRRLEGRVLELGRRLTKLAEADPEYAATLEQRVDRLRRVGARLLAAYTGEKKRADRLQAELDDALGLNQPDIVDGRDWQSRRQDKPQRVRGVAS